MGKKQLIVLTAIALMVVFLPPTFAGLFLRNIPVYPVESPCSGKTVILSDDFSSLDYSTWTVSLGGGGQVEEANGEIEISGASIQTKEDKIKIPTNSTMIIKAREEVISNYKGYTRAYFYFFQEQGSENYYLGDVSLNPSLTKIRIDDRKSEDYVEKDKGVKEAFYHYQRKYADVSNLENYHYFEIKRMQTSEGYVKYFYVSDSLDNLESEENLIAVMNLTKPEESNAINQGEKLIIGSYPYQKIIVDSVEICEN